MVLSGAPARADTLSDCLAKHHACVTGEGRSLISQGQQAQLEQQIGDDDIYLVVAASGSSGYDAAMRQIISTLGAEKKEFVVGFLDSRLKHFGAYNRGMLAPGAAANIATTVVGQRQADQDIFAALQDFVRDVQQEAQAPGSSAAAASPASHTVRNVLIVLGVILLVVVLGGLFIWRPRRMRRQRELNEAKAAAQDDLLALSNKITDHENDVSVQSNPEAAAEQAAALAAYERGTAALDAARRPDDMRAVSRNIAEGQYRLACAEALANGQPKPGRRPMCFFDPRHGMSVTDVSWAPPDGGPSRMVPVCIDDARKIDQGIQPGMRTVEDNSGSRVAYVNSGFAPRTGAASATAERCSAVSCSARLSRRQSSSTSTATATRDITTAGTTTAETTTAEGTSAETAAVTSAAVTRSGAETSGAETSAGAATTSAAVTSSPGLGRAKAGEPG